MANDFRIAQDWVTSETLNGTSTYAVNSFPVQSDMLGNIRWIDPADPSDIYSEAAEWVMALDNTSGGNGGIEFDWYLFLPTRGMVEYIKQTIFGGQRSRKFTVQTRRRDSLTNKWTVVWCWGVLPDERSDAESVGGGFQKFKVHFFDGVLAASGSEFTNEFTYEFT